MYRISKFNNCQSPNVESNLKIEEIINTIKNGDENIDLIKGARRYPKGSQMYKSYKEKHLPTFRFNFEFDKYAKNDNIIKSTGLLYVDADNINEIPDNDYVYAKWKSLSRTGYGVLVKTHNVNSNNLKQSYTEVSDILNIETDKNACKATQQTVLSYDSGIYFNPNSTTYSATTIEENITYIESDTNSKKVSFPTIKKRKERIRRNDTFSEVATRNTIVRFNNINDYFQNEYENELFRIFDEKIMICDPYIPRDIPSGKRNSTLFFLLSQYKLLNPYLSKSFFESIANTINSKMRPNLPSNEVQKTLNSVLKSFKNNSLELYLNSDRRILFNPQRKIPYKEKMQVVNTELGKLKSLKTQEHIYAIIENWDFNELGKITQKKVTELSEKSLPTVKRYWSNFKEYVKELNTDFKNGKTSSFKNEIQNSVTQLANSSDIIKIAS